MTTSRFVFLLLLLISPFYKNIPAPVAKFVVPEWEYIVDSGIGLSYRPASLCSLADRLDNPMPESTLSAKSGTKNLAPGNTARSFVCCNRENVV